MRGYDNATWVGLYHHALVELEHAKMRGCIGEARDEIAARIESLRNMPGLHTEELHAIEDALRALTSLERSEERYAAQEERHAEEERRATETALEKLRSVWPKIEKLKNPRKGLRDLDDAV